MNLPIDVVIDLLMTGSWNDVTYWAVMIPRPKTGLSPLRITADTESDLRTKVREYLLILVPKPKLLSECEEGKLVEVEYVSPRFRVEASREGDYAVGRHGDVVGIASDYQVIQPVEVQ